MHYGVTTPNWGDYGDPRLLAVGIGDVAIVFIVQRLLARQKTNNIATSLISSPYFFTDAGDRVTQIVDSVNGTITRSYDGLDRLLTETTPQGAVTYAYDTANRRTSMTVTGQSVVNYTYDSANR